MFRWLRRRKHVDWKCADYADHWVGVPAEWPNENAQWLDPETDGITMFVAADNDHDV